MTCHYDNIFTWKTRYCTTQSLLLSGRSYLQPGLRNTVPIGCSNMILTDVNTNHWKIPVTPTYDCSNTAMTFRKKHNFNVQTYNTQLVGAATSTPCPAKWIPIFIWVYAFPKKIPAILYPNILLTRWWGHSKEIQVHKGIVQLDNGLVIRHVEVIQSFLQGLLDIVMK